MLPCTKSAQAGSASALAVIFAGGTGSRMHGARLPKQFLELDGRPIIAHTLQHFQDHERVEAIFVACLEPWISYLGKVVERFGFGKVQAIVAGGATCQLSIAAGLEAAWRWVRSHHEGKARDAVVLVHDGVRPLIDAHTISHCIASVERFGSAITVAPAIETIILGEDGRVTEVVDRSRCKLARAPQAFWLSELLAAHRRAQTEGRKDFIDCLTLMTHYGYEAHTVEGPPDNIKITTRRDFFAFKGYVDYKEMEQLWEG